MKEKARMKNRGEKMQNKKKIKNNKQNLVGKLKLRFILFIKL